MSLKDMRDQLRALRKEHVKPVSRMRKADISAELNKLAQNLEDTPSAGKGSPPAPRETESHKKAAVSELSAPAARPVKEKKARVTGAKEEVVKVSKKKSKLATLMRLLEESDDE